MRSTWGDFRRLDTASLRPSDGPGGRLVGVGLLLVVVGLVVVVMGVLVTYSDLNGPNDRRADKSIPFLWVPGAVAAVVGVALLAWAWWHSSHTD